MQDVLKKDIIIVIKLDMIILLILMILLFVLIQNILNIIMKYKYSESTEAPTHPDFLFQASVHKNPLVVNTYSKGNTLFRAHFQ